jgi:opine dehydrogenase
VTQVRTIAVLGAGNGGCAAAADLGNRGLEVRLFNRSRDRLEPIIARRGIEMIGALGEVFVPLEVVTDDLERAIRGADLVMLCVPTSAHPVYAQHLAPLIGSGQIVFLNPGHMGGGLFMAHEIHRLTGRVDIRTCEATTLTYGCRMKEPTVVNILFVLRNLAFAAFPGKFQGDLYETMKGVYPGLVQARNVLETGFLCINSVEHPPQAVCNAGWIEFTKGDYLFYHDGTSPSVGRVIDELDRERIAVADAAGIPTKPFVTYFYESGYTSERAAQVGTAYAALQDSEPNRWIKGPKSLDHRYMHEDVGRGLVPWSEMGGALGVGTPTMDALITLASVMNGIDYRTEGMTLDRIGLGGRDPSDYDRFLFAGIEATSTG